MSKQVDDRVVEMQFDNAQFEKNVKTSISTIDKLKQSLNFTGVGDSIEKVTKKFSAFEVIATGALLRIGSQAVTMGERLIKSLTIDQISAGWEKFAEKTTSVQTIMAATRETWESSADALARMNWLMEHGVDRTIAEGLAKQADGIRDGVVNIDEAVENLGGRASIVMSNLANRMTFITHQGSQMDYVTEQLDRLNWFTDETSYKLVDMSSNIGKFTAAGVALEPAVSAMEGIATWAAISGRNADAASIAMYNMSQALGSGAVLAVDWKSIENQNMNTMEFKQIVIDTAEELGTLKKTAEDTWVTLDGHEVTNASFRENLADRWFSSDVLLESLKRYGDFAVELQGLADKSQLSAKELLDGLTAYKEASGGMAEFLINEGVNEDIANGVAERYQKIASGMMTMEEAAEELGVSGPAVISNLTTRLSKFMRGSVNFEEMLETIKESGGDADLTVEDLIKDFNRLTDSTYDLGMRAFIAAQEAKTFGEAIDYVREAVSTGWLKTFEYIFGNYEEAKALWSNLAEELYTIFVESGDIRNEILKGWKKLGGRNDLVDAFWNIQHSITAIITSIREGIQDIFNPIWSDVENGSERLFDLTKRIKEFTEAITIVDSKTGELNERGEKLHRVFKGIFAILGLVKDIISAFLKPLKGLFKGMTGIGGSFLDASASIADMLVNLREYVNQSGVLQQITDRLTAAFEELGSGFAIVAEGFRDIVDGRYSRGFRKILEGLTSGIGSFVSVLLGLDPGELKKKVEDIFDWVESKFSSLKENFNGFGEFIHSIAEWIKQTFAKLSEVDTSGVRKIGDAFQYIFGGLWGFFNAVLPALGQVLSVVLPALGKALGEAMTRLGNALDKITLQDIINVLKDGIQILIGIEIYRVFQFLDDVDEVMDRLGKLLKKWKKKIKASTILAISASVGILVLAIYGIMKMMEKPDGFRNALTAMGGLVIFMGELVGMIAVLNKIKKGDTLDRMGPMLIKLAAALWIMSFAVKNLAGIDSGLWSAVGAIAALMAVMALVLKILDWNPSDKNAIWSKLFGIEPKQIEAGAKRFIALSIAILILSYAIKNISSIDNPESVKKSVLAISALIVGLGGVMKLLQSKDNSGYKKAASALLGMAIAVEILVLVIKQISKMREESIWKAMGVLSTIIALLAVAMGIIEYTGGNLSGWDVAAIIVFVLGIAKLASIVEKLAKIPFWSMMGAIAGLAAIMAVLVGMTYLMNKIDADDWSMAKIATGLLILAVAIGVLGKTEPATIGIALVALVGVLAIIVGFSYLLKPVINVFYKFGEAIKSIGIGVLAFGAGIALLALSMNRFIKLAKPFAKAVVDFLIVVLEGLPEILAALFRGLTDSLEEFRQFIVSAVKILCVVLVESLWLIVDYSDDLAQILTEFILALIIGALNGTAARMPEISEALHNFVEAFVKSFGTVDIETVMIAIAFISALETFFILLAALTITALIAVAPLPLIGKCLTGFANTMIPFFDVVKSIDPSLIDNAKTIVDLIAAFAGVTLASGFSTLLFGNDELEKVGKQLASFAPYYKQYADTMSRGNFDSDLVSASANAAKVLVEMAKSSKALNGVNKKETLTKFGEELENFAPHLVAYANTMSKGKFDAVLVSASAVSASALADMANVVPPYIDEGAWTGFATELANFAPKFAEYAQAINVDGMDTDLVERSANAIKALAAMADEIPNSGGKWAEIFGDNTLTDFAAGLVEFAPSFVVYANTISGAYGKFGVVEESVEPIRSLITMANGLVYTGQGELSAFGQELADFAPKFMDYAKAVVDKDVNLYTVRRSADVVAALVDVADRVIGFSGAGVGWLVDFAEDLKEFAPGFVDYAKNICSADLDYDKVTASATAILSWADTISALSTTKVNEQILSKLGSELSEFGPNYAKYCQDIAAGIGVNFQFVDRATNSIKTIAIMMDSISNKKVNKGLLGKFGEELKSFGPNFVDYVDSISSVSGDGFTMAESSASPIKALCSAVDAISQKKVNKGTLGKFGEELKSFGPSLADYISNIGSFTLGQAVSVQKTSNAVWTLSQTLGNISTDQVNSGALSKFGEELSTFVPYFLEYCNGVTNIPRNFGYIERSAKAVINVADILNYIPDVDTDTVLRFGKSLWYIGYYVELFGQKAPNFAVNDIDTAIDEVEKLVDMVRDISDLDLDSVTGFTQALVDLGNYSVDQFIQTFFNGNAKVIEAVRSLMTCGVNSVKRQKDSFKSAISSCVSAMVTSIRGYYSSFKSAAYYLVTGFVAGINENTWRAEAEARALAEATETAAKEELEQNSPSKKFYNIGSGSVEGLVNAMRDGRKVVYKSSTALANASIRGASDAIQRLAASIDSDMDMQPTIRPVLDLSDVEAGARKLNAMFSADQAYSISASMEGARGSSPYKSEYEGTSYNFVQNNYSPKALSPTEIYRNTRNQFSRFKGVINSK